MTDFTAVPYPYTAVIRTNSVTNPRVAVDLTSWSYNPGTGGTGGIGGPYDISTPPADVPWANKHLGYVQSASASDGAGPYVATPGLSGGRTYTASGYMRPSTSRSVRLVVDWYNASSTYLTTSIGASVAATAGQWSRVSLTAVAPATAVSANVGFRDLNATTAGLTVDVTCAMFEDSGALGTYFDGSSPAADAQVGRLIYWSGTANASASKDETRTPTSAATRALGVRVNAWDGTSDPLQTVHRLLGTSDIVVTIARPSGPRQGTIRCLCPDQASAESVETVLRTGLVMLNTSGMDRVTMYGQMSGVQVTPIEGGISYTVVASFVEMGKGSQW